MSGVSNSSSVKLVNTALIDAASSGRCSASPQRSSVRSSSPSERNSSVARASMFSDRSMPNTCPAAQPPWPTQPDNGRCRSRFPESARRARGEPFQASLAHRPFAPLGHQVVDLGDFVVKGFGFALRGKYRNTPGSDATSRWMAMCVPSGSGLLRGAAWRVRETLRTGSEYDAVPKRIGKVS